ncbi:MAG: DUF3576 domain-containing protein [Alphaproteobacteria bacterium]
MRARRLFLPVMVVLASLLAGCSGGTVAEDAGDDVRQKRLASLGKVGGSGIEGIFGDDGGSNNSGGISVNSFLWRASLDTISFFPLTQADPFGGVIITDWYAAPETPDARFKLNVFILGRELRADGLRVSAFKQIRTASGQWIDAPVGEETVYSLENAILARARELRIAAAALE